MEFNKKIEEVIKPIFTGLAVCKVVAVNPTKRDLINMGIYEEGTDKTPTYLNDKGTMRVEFWLETVNKDKVLSKIAFFISDTPLVSTKTKVDKILQFDAFGRSCWGEPNPKYIDVKTLQEGDYGKIGLVNFFRVLTKIERTKALDVEELNFDKIIAGDTSHLKKILEEVNSYGEQEKVLMGVKALFGVKDGYQDVYTTVWPDTTVNIAKITKDVTSNYGGYKEDYQGSLEWKQYVPSMEINALKPDTPVQTDYNDSSEDALSAFDETPY